MGHRKDFSALALTRARELRTVSKTQLSDLAGVSRQTIDDLERGATRDPAPRTVDRLAEALAVTTDFFYFEPGDAPPREALHLRTRVQDVPKKVTARLCAKAELFHRVTRRLNEHVRFPTVAIPHVDRPPGGFSRPELERIATACRERWRLPSDSPILTMTRTLERAGVLVSNFKDDHVAVQAFCWRSWRPLVFVNRLTADDGPVPVTRVRYDLGHELGHLVLHDGLATGDKAREREANRFAAAFLVPERAFRREFRAFSTRVDWDALFRLKARWGVSLQALVERAHDLGLVTEQARRYFYTQLSKRGERRREPHEPALVEEPEITRRVVETLKQRLDLTAWELAQSVAMDACDFSEIVGVDVGPPDNVLPFRRSTTSGSACSR